MNSSERIFKRRFGEAAAKGIRYFMLVAGGGGMPILFILAAVGVVYGYVSFLKWLPTDFPAYALMAVVVSLALTQTSVRTFIQPADVVFLLPLESEMQHYFRRCLTYSVFMQVVKVGAVMALLLPLYRARIGDETGFLIALAFVALFKAWNVYAHFRELHLQNGRGVHIAFRLAANVLLTVPLFYGGSVLLYTLIAALILAMLTLYYRKVGAGNRYPWYTFVALEQRRVNALYTFASFFVDVPHILQRTKARAWLAVLLQRIPYGARNTHLYLYARTFLRSGEYFSLFLRLTTITAIVIVFIPTEWAVFAAFLVGLTLTGIQLPAVRAKHLHAFWLKLYPVEQAEDKRALAQLVCIALAVQSVIVSAVYLIVHQGPLLALALASCGLLFSYAFSFVYLPGRLKDESYEV
ncbi:ABC transporter permease [Numidum massiliense]|uniref:ABC transporter permease n=1 Tax=Numidum massiliense TaxID=1522315 RepID=UPI0006D58287|nr:ABC transporter permease [Numidum massiliense]